MYVHPLQPPSHPHPIPLFRVVTEHKAGDPVSYSSFPLAIYLTYGQLVSQFSRLVVSKSLQPHEPQHTRLPCPSPTPGVHPNPCQLSRWCHPTILSSVVSFSSCPQSFPASGSFQMSQLFTSGGQSIGVSASTSVLPMNTQDCHKSVLKIIYSSLRVLPGFPVLHHLPELAQTYVLWVSDAIQPSRLLLPPSPAFNLSQHQNLFTMSRLFASGDQSTGASASASVLPMSIQGWFPLRLIGLVSLLSKGLSQESSPVPQLERINSLAYFLLYDSALTTVCDYWKDHRLDYTNLC